MPRVQPNRRRSAPDPELEQKIDEFSRSASTAPEPPAQESNSPKVAEVSAKPLKVATSVGFNFKMTPEDHRRLKALCEREERSIQYMLNRIVWAAVTELEQE